MELKLAKSQDALILTYISKKAFESDIEVGGTQVGGPPGYKSQNYYMKMASTKHLYSFYYEGLIVGGAVLFREQNSLYIGRIFISPDFFNKGFGIKLMELIEEMYPDVESFTLDTPLWNVRTNNFYTKLGYKITKKDDEFAYYTKTRD